MKFLKLESEDETPAVKKPPQILNGKLPPAKSVATKKPDETR